MCGGGSGGAQNTVSEFKPPERTNAGWDAYVQSGQKLSQTPYAQSGLSTVAPINATQQTAMQMAIDRALMGAPDINAGRSAAMNAANGAYADPYQQNLYGMAAGEMSNPYMSDEYMENMIGANAEDMAGAYATGTAAQTDAAAAMAGAYGGSGHTQMMDANAQGLAKQVGQMANSTRAQQQQYKGAMYQQDVGNMLSANQMGMGAWQNSVGNMLSGSALAGQLSKDDYESIKMLMGTGGDYRAYEQQLIDAANQQWGTQNSYDSTMNEYLGNVLARASGGQGSTTVTNNSPGASPLMGLLGGGLAAYGAFG